MAAKAKTVVLAFALFMSLAGAIAVVIAFSTDYWLDYTVNRKGLEKLAITAPQITINLKNNPLYFTRHRGIFRTCYEGTADELSWLDTYEPATDIVNVNCLIETGYELKRDPKTISYGSEYDLRIHLMRLHFAFLCLAMVFLVIGLMILSVGACRTSLKLLRSSGLLIFLGAFSMALAQAFFHGVDYLEKQKIDVPEPPFPYSWNSIAPLDTYARVQYGYSYGLGWICVGFSFFGAVITLCGANIIMADEVMDDVYMAKTSEKTGQPYPFTDMTYQPHVINQYPNQYPMTIPAITGGDMGQFNYAQQMMTMPMAAKITNYDTPKPLGQPTYIDDMGALQSNNITNPYGI